jgi:uncharacterized membrane protein
MFVPIPIGLWVFSLVADIVYRSGGAPVWEPIAFWTMAGGTVGALVAAVPGFIDFLSLRDRRTWRLAATHMALNLTIVTSYAVNLWLRTRSLPGSAAPFWLSVGAIALLLVSGWLGGELVYVRGVAVEPAARAPGEAEIRAERRGMPRTG